MDPYDGSLDALDANGGLEFELYKETAYSTNTEKIAYSATNTDYAIYMSLNGGDPTKITPTAQDSGRALISNELLNYSTDNRNGTGGKKLSTITIIVKQYMAESGTYVYTDSETVIVHMDGAAGMDGASSEYVYCKAEKGATVTLAYSSEGETDYTKASVDKNGVSYNNNDYIPWGSNWTDNPQGVSHNEVEWCAVRRKSADTVVDGEIVKGT